jgi:hypothetical protein
MLAKLGQTPRHAYRALPASDIAVYGLSRIFLIFIAGITWIRRTCSSTLG